MDNAHTHTHIDTRKLRNKNTYAYTCAQKEKERLTNTYKRIRIQTQIIEDKFSKLMRHIYFNLLSLSRGLTVKTYCEKEFLQNPVKNK